jgi:20S proteasome alpha/beta subunit
MTMAAGFVLNEGVLLCADMLFSDGYTKEYRDKVFTWNGKNAGACFAISGNAAVARMAIDDCRNALAEYDGESLTAQDIILVVRSAIQETYVNHVDARPPEERSIAEFQVLIGLTAAHEQPKLFSTWHTAVVPVDTFECLGNGRHLGRYIAEPSYKKSLSLDDATGLAIYMLAAAKDRTDGVGGRSQFVYIRNDSVGDVVTKDVSKSEPLALEYQQRSTGLFHALAHPEDLFDMGFEAELVRFVAFVQKARMAWKDIAFEERPFLERLRAGMVIFNGTAPKVVIKPSSMDEIQTDHGSED